MESTNTGTLIVQVYTADQTLPITGANVIVTKTVPSGEELVKVIQTDRSGKTEPILLPAPPASNSQTPDGGVRFSNYNVRVDNPGYYTMENINVPIFDGQTAIQPFALIPLASGEEQGKKITVVEEEPEELE
ncbi:MAG: hypothetical protein IKW62_02705 [Clostridia bacterium]|nr:hypothetical protein [Clostridia bacterium]